MNIQDHTILSKLDLKDYFKLMYDSFTNDWKVEAAQELLGKGRSNQGTEESKAINRYYVKPNDERFDEIYINHDPSGAVDSVVWFIQKALQVKLRIEDLQDLFGEFSIHNVIYDETTVLVFVPTTNPSVASIRTSIPEWVERRNDGTLYFRKKETECIVDEKYPISSLVLRRNE